MYKSTHPSQVKVNYRCDSVENSAKVDCAVQAQSPWAGYPPNPVLGSGIGQVIGQVNHTLNKPELQTLNEDLSGSNERLKTLSLRVAQVANRLLGMEPEGTDPAGKMAGMVHDSSVMALRYSLSELRADLDTLEHHLMRLERL